MSVVYETHEVWWQRIFFDSIPSMTSMSTQTGDDEVRFQIREKWGEAVGVGGLTGFVAIPEALIRSQKNLDLSSTEMMVLINVLLHWWFVERMPFPSNQAIAKRMGVGERTVQRAFVSLENKKLIRREVMRFYDPETRIHSSKRTVHLEPLVERLIPLAANLRSYAAERKTVLTQINAA